MIDTHAHIYLSQFDGDLHEMLNRAESVGITQILMPAIDFESEELMNSIISRYGRDTKIALHRMAGIHPCDVSGPIDEDRLLDWCSKPESIAIGETGLDYYWSTEHVSDQKKSLQIHCRIAKSLNKPIVLHNRDSSTDLLDLIESEQNGSLRGVWHCFTGTVDEGKRAIDMGFQLGIGGVVTFKNGGVDKTVKQLDLKHFILETDSPYLAPTPHRGKRNEPMYTQLIGIKLSEIFDVSLSEIDRITSLNARELFSLDS